MQISDAKEPLTKRSSLFQWTIGDEDKNVLYHGAAELQSNAQDEGRGVWQGRLPLGVPQCRPGAKLINFVTDDETNFPKPFQCGIDPIKTFLELIYQLLLARLFYKWKISLSVL